MGWDIVQNDSSTAANRLQGASALINDSYKYVMDLTTNGVVVNDAIKYVQGQMDHLTSQEKKLLKEIKHKGESGEMKTLNGRRSLRTEYSSDSDVSAANVLTESKRYSHAIYFYGQAFEKPTGQN